MSLSVRGIARQFRGVTGTVSVRQTYRLIPLPGFPTNIPSLRGRLELIARRELSFSVSECIYGWTAAFEQTWSRVRVRIQLSPDAGITAATITTLRTAWENGIETTWNNRWAIGRAGERPCPLEFDVLWVTNGAHHNVRVRPGPAQSNMTTWDTQDSGAVSAHEFGHMLGNPDEYTDTNCPGRSPVNSGTVMDNNSANIPSRLMNRLATNVGSSVVAIP
jgi:hypothetical protein